MQLSCCQIFTCLFFLLRNPALEFVAAPALAPAEVSVDKALMKRYEDELLRVSYLIRRIHVLYFTRSKRLKVFLFLMTTMNSECGLSVRLTLLFPSTITSIWNQHSYITLNVL